MAGAFEGSKSNPACSAFLNLLESAILLCCTLRAQRGPLLLLFLACSREVHTAGGLAHLCPTPDARTTDLSSFFFLIEVGIYVGVGGRVSWGCERI
jgi:hypothetical protein